ncbi:MAG: hypothetical protein HQ477_11900 [Chloroflexi bacterium]|nr:hypothetical protein [Chloroflexota bacterium]
MRLPDEIRTRLADEFTFASERMREEGVPLRKLYFFSAVFGEVGRELNRHWDPTLALIHQVSNLAYQQINGRLQQIIAGDNTLPVGKELLAGLDETAAQLARMFCLEDIPDQDILNVLGRMSELSYATTGNGYYLLTRQRIQLKKPQ